MFSIRNVGGVSLFLFGTTFLWLTPVYAASGIDTSSAAWATAGVFATVTMIGFIVATWGLFRRTGGLLRSAGPCRDGRGRPRRLGGCVDLEPPVPTSSGRRSRGSGSRPR